MTKKAKTARVVGGLINHLPYSEFSYNDSNLYYKQSEPGLSVFVCDDSTKNAPEHTRCILHIQRIGRDEVSGSQYIFQRAYTHGDKEYRRSGVGDTKSIIYQDWVEI